LLSSRSGWVENVLWRVITEQRRKMAVFWEPMEPRDLVQQKLKDRHGTAIFRGL
jgi:hypothetical protein